MHLDRENTEKIKYTKEQNFYFLSIEIRQKNIWYLILSQKRLEYNRYFIWLMYTKNEKKDYLMVETHLQNEK